VSFNLQGPHLERRSGSVRWGPRLGGVLGGGAPGPLGRALSCTGTPGGGGGGPKKRHLVLYKLAGFCTADRRRRGAFFSLHSSRLVFNFLSKKGKNPPKMADFGPKIPIFGILDPLFSRFFAFFRPGRGDPFFRGDPPGRGVPGVRAEPPLPGGSGGADGGV
jgi:hypothetical protein